MKFLVPGQNHIKLRNHLHSIREDLQKCRQGRVHSGHSKINSVRNVESVDHQEIAENSVHKQLTQGFCSDSVDLKLACIMVSEEESETSSEWATGATKTWSSLSV